MTNATPKTTKKDFYNTILALVEGAKSAGLTGYNFDELTEMANKEIVALDKKAKQAKERAQKNKEAGDELREQLLSTLTHEPQTLAEILAAIQAKTGDTQLSTQKITPRLSQLVDLKVAVKSEVAIQGPDGGKSRKLAAYSLA